MAKQRILTLEEAQKRMSDNGGNLDLRGTAVTGLPDGLAFDGDLLCGNRMSKLPAGLKVGGNLDLSCTQIAELPDGLTVGRSLYLNFSQVRALPDNLSVGGSLYLQRSKQIRALPDNLSVNGNLDLSYTPITELPSGLTVGGSLYLDNTQITKLPDGLIVGRDLDLHNTPIAKLPDNLTVGGYLFAERPLFAQIDLLAELPKGLTVGKGICLLDAKTTKLPDSLTVDGDLYLSNSQISKLPAGLTVRGDLVLMNNTKITELPAGLTVGGWLFATGSQIAKLSDGLTVGEGLILRNTPITELPENLTVGGYLDLDGTQIKTIPKNLTIGGVLGKKGSGISASQAAKAHRLKNGDRGDGSYIYADGTLIKVKEIRNIDGYTVYVGSFPFRNMVTDGEFYAPCDDFRVGVKDIARKRVEARGREQYLGIDRDTPIPIEDAKVMYRVITGTDWDEANNLVYYLERKIGLKDAYTVNEMLSVTKGPVHSRPYKSGKFTYFFSQTMCE